MTVAHEGPIAHHLGFAVYNADNAARRYEQMLGAKLTLIPEYPVVNLYGEAAMLRVYYGAIPGMALEIIEVTAGHTCHVDWLRVHGEGIQHIGIWVPDVVKATEEAVANGARIEWVHVSGSKVTASLTAASPVRDVLAAAGNEGLTYVDIREGGTQLEFIGPAVQDRLFREGGSLFGLEALIARSAPGQ